MEKGQRFTENEHKKEHSQTPNSWEQENSNRSKKQTKIHLGSKSARRRNRQSDERKRATEPTEPARKIRARIGEGVKEEEELGTAPDRTRRDGRGHLT